MRREEADAERLALIEDRWVEDHMLVFTNCYIAAVRAEAERYTGTRQIVLDYYRDAYSAVSIANLCHPHKERFFVVTTNRTNCSCFWTMRRSK